MSAMNTDDPFISEGAGVFLWCGIGALLEVSAFAVACLIPWGRIL